MLTKNFKQLQSEVAAHVKADSVAQRSYKTCFIGCLANQKDDPKFIEETYGIPLPLLRLSESIFENLSNDEAVDFFAQFSKAVESDDKDLTLVVWQFLALELRALPPVSDEVQALIDSVIEGMDLLSRGEPWHGAAHAARAAHAANAGYAAAAAGYAADAAVSVASAAAADAAAYYPARAAADVAVTAAACADAADVAVSAAYAAAYAARAAAYSTDVTADAQAAARRRQRDTLLRLIKEAPINTMEIK